MNSLHLLRHFFFISFEKIGKKLFKNH